MDSFGTDFDWDQLLVDTATSGWGGHSQKTGRVTRHVTQSPINEYRVLDLDDRDIGVSGMSAPTSMAQSKSQPLRESYVPRPIYTHVKSMFEGGGPSSTNAEMYEPCENIYTYIDRPIITFILFLLLVLIFVDTYKLFNWREFNNMGNVNSASGVDGANIA